MKTKLLLFSLVLFAFSSLKAHVITVSNNSISAGHFTNLQIAIDSANVNDTVYVEGSPTDYGTATITTKITLIGAGYAVTGAQNNWSSQVDYIYIDSVPHGSKVSGTKIMGMAVNNNISYSGTFYQVNNVDIERCYVGSGVTILGINWTLTNNILNYIYNNTGYFGNLLIQNNFLGYIQYSNQATVTIDHNDFVTNNGSVFYSISNAMITNNVFYFTNPSNGTNVSNCTYSNNFTVWGSSTYANPNLNAYPGNTGQNNDTTSYYLKVWNDKTIPASTVSQNAIWNYNWSAFVTPTNSSPNDPTTGATDGGLIGVYGGTHPMPNLTGATRIPQMTLLMNNASVVPVGGNLNVNFKARVQK
ncbi:MAG TPA: hypothetical protein VN922_12630 [Bacteroidia bacterium]|nr:hypothetical protein [Bacteroidia bacterium]